MPYKVRKRKDKFCVFNEATGEQMKCYNTRTEAEDYQKALYANVPDAKGKSLDPVKHWRVAKRKSQWCLTIKQTGAKVHCYKTKAEAENTMRGLYAGLNSKKVDGKPEDIFEIKSVDVPPCPAEVARAISQLVPDLTPEQIQGVKALIDVFELRYGGEPFEEDPAPAPTKSEGADPEDTLVAWGGEVKSLGIEEVDGKQMAKIGGHLVLYGDPNQKDLTGDYFTPETYFGPRDGDNSDTMVHHGSPIKTGNAAIDFELKVYAQQLLNPLTTRRDPLGIWAETVLDLSDNYQKKVYELVEKGAFKWSSGTAKHMILREEDGKLSRWPIIEGSLTPTPAEPRMLRSRVVPLKSLTGDDDPLAPDKPVKSAGWKDDPFANENNNPVLETATDKRDAFGALRAKRKTAQQKQNWAFKRKWANTPKPTITKTLAMITMAVPDLNEQQTEGLKAILEMISE